MNPADPERASVRNRVERVERLLAGLDTLPDAAARARAGEAVEALVQLYGDALARIMAAVAASNDPGLAAVLADDNLVCHLLLVHDLHPLSAEERVRTALESLPASVRGDVSLVGVDGGVARIRVGGAGGGGCGAPSVEQLVEAAVWDSAPDLDGVEVERRVAPVPVELRRGPRPSATAPVAP